MKKLRVCHYPQLPCEPFIVEVEDLKEAKLLFDRTPRTLVTSVMS